MKIWTTLLAVLLMVLGAAIGAIFLATPGFHNTSLDVRLFGYGKTPQQCIVRLEKNFEAIEPHMTAVAEVLQREEQAISVIGYVDRNGKLEVDLGTIVPEENSEDSGGEATAVRSLLSESSLEVLDREVEAITFSRNAYQPWEIGRDPRDGAIVAKTSAGCGLGTLDWWRYVFGQYRSKTEPGSPAAGLSFEFGVLGTGDKRDRCLSDGMTMTEDGFGSCVHDTGLGWVARQDWRDMCAFLNHRGWDGFFEDTPNLNEESRAGFEYLRDQGQTPCQALNR